VLLAAYVIFHVKESIPDCGKDTDVVCIQSDGIEWLDRNKIKEMEDLFVSCLGNHPKPAMRNHLKSGQ